MRKHWGLGLVFVLVGCDDALKTVELVEEPRVLGARVEVTGDTGRAAPAPGETVTVSFLLASPSIDQSLGFALSACPATVTRGTRAGCASPPFADVGQDDGEAETPSFAFEVPSALDPGGRVAVLGIVCPDGSPNQAATDCVGSEPGTPVSLEFELSREGDVNLNPSLASGLSFDAGPWPALPAIMGDCEGLGYVEVTAGSKHVFEVVVDEDDRDVLPQPSELDPARESLQLSHFVSAGDLSRAFETIAWDSDELVRTTSWTAPDRAGLVRFWLVLRDFRGGSDFVERAVCVVPP